MADPWIVSPSQINEWRSCNRKLLWRIVVGIKPPSNQGAIRGDKVHKELEQFLNSKDKLDEEYFKILEPAIQYFPPPGQCETETKFKFEWDGHWYGGRIDAKSATTVYDLKTTKDKKYAKDAETLQTDPQSIIYFRAHKDSVENCRWVYTLTGTKRKAWPVDFTPIVSGPIVDKLHADAEAITEAVGHRRLPLAIPPPEDLSICKEYGGCPYRPYCKDITPLAGMFSNKSELSMTMQKMLERVKTNPINPPEESDAGAPATPELTKAELMPTVPENDLKPVADTPPLTIAMLLVDCFPMNSSLKVIDVATVISQAHEQIKKQLDVADYTFIEFRGAGLLNAATQQLLAELPENADGTLTLFVDSSLRESKVVLTELLAHANVVIRRV